MGIAANNDAAYIFPDAALFSETGRNGRTSENRCFDPIWVGERDITFAPPHKLNIGIVRSRIPDPGTPMRVVPDSQETIVVPA